MATKSTNNEELFVVNEMLLVKESDVAPLMAILLRCERVERSWSSSASRWRFDRNDRANFSVVKLSPADFAAMTMEAEEK